MSYQRSDSSKDDGRTVEEALLEEDVPGNKRSTRMKMEANYDSDSSVEGVDSDEEEEDVQSEPEKPVANDSDDDMFASDNDEPITKTKKKQTKFLDVQQFHKDEELEDYEVDRELKQEDSDSEQEEENLSYFLNPEDEHGPRRHDRIEPKLDAFNLKEEAETGKFDMSGNYIRDEEDEEDPVEDAWMDEYKLSEINKAKEAQLEREKEAKEARRSANRTFIPTDSLLSDLITLLEPAETSIEALQRLNIPRKKRKKQTEDDEKILINKHKIEDITELCDKLMNSGMNDIYNVSREELMRQYRTETGHNYEQPNSQKRSRHEAELEEEDRDVGDKIWQFHWIDHEDEINGPYSSYEMKYWTETYFENNVKVRKVGEIEFQSLETVNFD